MLRELYKYAEEHSTPQPPLLNDIERRTNIHLINGRMCSGLLQGRFLKMLVNMIRPKRVLELGTFSGFASLCIAEALEPDATLDTIEIDDELEDFIRQNFSISPHGHKINLHIGAAEMIASGWEKDTFDLVFLDADKRRYCEDFDIVFPLVKPGGYIIADNTLWDGHVIEPQKHNDPQTRGIIEFNEMIRSRSDIEAVMLPLRDGLTLIRKNT
ncbi:MAG: O-methyltransferase [Muribaculaceae bacterium]|nr:O-methyltransferase [Muribaculaceae bacterium]